jgi:hypothetical protein
MAAISQFFRVESFAPILREPVWQQDRDVEASSIEARTRLAYERARSLIKALGRISYNPLKVRSTLIARFRNDNRGYTLTEAEILGLSSSW